MGRTMDFNFIANSLHRLPTTHVTAANEGIARAVEQAEVGIHPARNTADLLELGHDTTRSSAGAAALLLDMFA